jgi:hypothetical protein
MRFASYTGKADYKRAYSGIYTHNDSFFTAILPFLYKTFMTANATPGILHAAGWS